MNDLPILMTPENGQKCHDGTKMQTRRIVNPQPIECEWNGVNSFFHHGKYYRIPGRIGPKAGTLPCPYGQVGGRLWVREAWKPWDYSIEEVCVDYRGAGEQTNNQSIVFSVSRQVKDQLRLHNPRKKNKWRPSIFMPRWACRTVLEITAIRVERLQKIVLQDIVAEGLLLPPDGVTIKEAVEWWIGRWEKINGAGSWDANPWVWAISFMRVSCEEAG